MKSLRVAAGAAFVSTVTLGATACGESKAYSPAITAAIDAAAAHRAAVTQLVAQRPGAPVGCASQVLSNSLETFYVWLVCNGGSGGEFSSPAVVTFSHLPPHPAVTSIRLPSQTDYAGSLSHLFPSSLLPRLTSQKGVKSPISRT